MDGTTYTSSDFREVAPDLWFPFQFGYGYAGLKDEYRVREVRVNEDIDTSKLVLRFPRGTEVDGQWWRHLGEQAAMPLILFVVSLLSLFGLGYLARATLSFVRRRAKS